MTETDGARQARRRRGTNWPYVLLGIGALFSGAALLAYLLAGLSLPLTLALTGSLLLAAVALVWWRTDFDTRRLLRSVVVRGGLVALAALVAYDASRQVLAQLDPSPFDPFAAIPIFGELLLGGNGGAALAAGIGFHVLNGVSFGLAYAFLFGRLAVGSLRLAIVSGAGWGLFLEMFQLTIYPGWLNVTTYREFATITFLGHVVYGLTLGALGHRFLPWPVDYPAERIDDPP